VIVVSEATAVEVMEIMNNKEKQLPSQETPVDMTGIVNRNIKARQ
jgi:hypothetical protein